MAASAAHAWRRATPVAGVPNAAVLAALAVAGCAAAASSFALALASDDVAEPRLQGALIAWMILLYSLGGLLAWRRRPESRFGALMLVAGFGIFVSSLSWANAALPYTVGQAFDLVPAVLFLHVFLAFPSGRLEHPLERVLVCAAYATALGVQLVGMALGGFGTENLLQVFAEQAVASDLLRLQLLALAAFALAGIAVLAVRRREAGKPLRRSVALLVDSFALALVMIAALFAFGAFGWAGFETIRRVTFVVICVAPVTFLIGILHARLARSAVADLFVDLAPDPAPSDLRDALARALRDPSLTLAYWLPEFGSWADGDGQAVELPDDDAARVTTLIDRNGGHVAALVHDPSLDDEPELLASATAGAAIALENGRLHSELRARLAELRGSRARVLEAGQEERQRLERNLHDGAQQRLIALSLDLSSLEEPLADNPRARTRLDAARSEIALSLAELRDVARGLHPAVVSGHGLEVALESLAAHASVPVQLRVELDRRLHEPVEVAAYYVVAESLVNVGKHAGAGTATVDVWLSQGDVVVEVADNGVGGADTERGSGLRGLADRVEALGGRLRVWSPRGGGTRVRAELPCA
jgi:signal transduction histidine kinase